MTACIDEACAAGARVTEACRVVAISPRTLQRWREEGEVKADGRQHAGQQREPANKLSEAERRQILAIANEPEFAHMPPSQIVPILADRGRYIASESSFYRVLREANQLAHRGKAKAPRHQSPDTAAGQRCEPAVELGYHLSGHDGQGPVLLSLPDHGCLQPQDRGMGGLRHRVRRSCRFGIPQGPSA